MKKDDTVSQSALRIDKAQGELGPVVALRLPPGADIYKTLEQVAESEGITSGLILSGLGSVKQVSLRNVRVFPEEFPIEDRHRVFTPKAEPMELLALTGNISHFTNRIHIHAHVVLSSGVGGGPVFGGHLVEGCIVFSTAEIVLCSIQGMPMLREMDPQTRTFELCFSPGEGS